MTNKMKFLNGMKIRTKLIFGFLSIILLIAVIGYVSIERSREMLISDIKKELTEKSFLVADSINGFIDNRITSIRVFSQADIFEGDIQGEDSRKKIIKYLTEIVQEDKHIVDINVIDLTGKVIASSGDHNKAGTVVTQHFSDVGSLFEQVKVARQGDVFVSELLEIDEGMGILFLTPITDDLNVEVEKILIIEMNIREITEMVSYFDERVIGNKFVYLVDNDGNVISTVDPMAKTLEPLPDLKVNHALLKEFETQGSVGNSTYTDASGDLVVAAFADMAEFGVNKALDWSLIAIAPFDEILLPASELRNNLFFIFIAFCIIISLISFYLINLISKPIIKLKDAAIEIGKGRLDTKIEIKSNDEIGDLADSFNTMAGKIRETSEENERQNWLKTGKAEIDNNLRGEQTDKDLGKNILSFIAGYLNILIGAIYIMTDKGSYRLQSSYAYKTRKNLSSEFKVGEGIVGQVVLERQSILLTKVPDDYIKVTSGLGEERPKNILVLPLINNEIVVGVLEIGSFEEFTDLQLAFLEDISNPIAIAITLAQSREILNNTIEQVRSQQEELKTSNEELEEQTKKLQASEEELKSQQEELQVTNEELEEKTQALEAQKTEVVNKNESLQKIQKDIEQKAEELAVSSKYKSEFLANMSHELRTPLNSLLILSQDMAANKKNNLDESQVQSADIIYNCGNDLLKLINEILDLSKVEAGKMTLDLEKIKLSEIINSINHSFQPVVEKKGLKMFVKVGEEMPESIQTDRQRIEQIIKNLLSNAIKFTDEGMITVDFRKTNPDDNLSRSGLDQKKSFAISIIDTGIGVPENKKMDIFEAFQQGDGSTSRKYGGTGLGLSISRELSKLLGGEIQITSTKGKGSTFTIFLPLELTGVEDSIVTEKEAIKTPPLETATPPRKASPSINDDGDNIEQDDRVILVIEDDLNFAEILFKFSHENGFKCVHAGDGETGLALAEKYMPNAIILDIKLPGIQGWQVLDALKSHARLRHIPVHIMTAEEETMEAYKKGAIGYLTKPIEKEHLTQAFTKIQSMTSGEMKNLLIIEDDEKQRISIQRLIGNSDVTTTAVANGKEGLEELLSKHYDCIILDLNLPDMSGFEILEHIDEKKEDHIPPVIIYTGKEITRDEEEKLQKYTSSIIIKGVKSPERLLDETALFLHRVISDLPENKQKMITSLYDKEAQFKGKKILLVDDDMRNVFAISQILQDKGIVVLKAGTGQKALDILSQETGVDLVLMDIMMPVMDGYEAMSHIRSQEHFRNLPIIALTAKAMKGDRDKCINAGANDYLTKPVNIDRLLSLMRVWLYK